MIDVPLQKIAFKYYSNTIVDLGLLIFIVTNVPGFFLISHYKYCYYYFSMMYYMCLMNRACKCVTIHGGADCGQNTITIF